ncbi:hypothetical protein ACFC4C_18805 [Streptomyces sp. NPDC056039]|uniref:hypothetical protein n=1 Tax=Streptomyces sp. NPDC056039 TaxID=3345687 RepID=UPI0035D65780
MPREANRWRSSPGATADTPGPPGSGGHGATADDPFPRCRRRSPSGVVGGDSRLRPARAGTPADELRRDGAEGIAGWA